MWYFHHYILNPIILIIWKEGSSMTAMNIINWIILGLGLFACGRILVGLILSNIHQIINNPKKFRKELAKTTDPHLTNPRFSILIPAYNEEKTIHDCVKSGLMQNYPNRQIVVVNDGSNDRTHDILEAIYHEFIESQTIDGQAIPKFDQRIPLDRRLTIIHQTNGGKSTALNHGLRTGVYQPDLITVLDADSKLAPDALSKMQKHFLDPKMIACADNVRIETPHKFIELVQEIEYLLGYRLKSSEEYLELNYIIGGIGSTFRYWALKEVNFYDTNTITEDIDLTLKLLNYFGNRRYKFGYAEDVFAYTPAVHNFKQLLAQRYRWKYGRFAALFKYNNIIWNTNTKKYSITLSWWKLPKVFFEEFIMLIDPIMMAWMLFLAVHFLDVSAMSTILIVYGAFAIATFIPEPMPMLKRIKLLLLSPFAFGFLYVINIVDWISLVRCIRHFKDFTSKKGTQANWVHVDR